MDVVRKAGRWFYAQPYLLLTLTPLMWGANAVAGRALVGEVSPMVTSFLRWLLVVVILALAIPGRILAEGTRLARHWPFILIMGAVGFTGFNAPLYLGAQTTTAVNMGMIQGIMPAMVMAGTFLAYRTPITALQIAGLLVALVGVGVTVTHGEMERLMALEFRAGDLWVLLACIFYSSYSVALRNRPPISALVFFAGLALAAVLSALPLVGWEIWAGTQQWPSTRGWLILVALAIFPSLISQVFYMRAVELIGPGRAGLTSNLVPVFAAGLAMLLLGESFAPYHAVALALVLGGIAVAEAGRPRAT